MSNFCGSCGSPLPGQTAFCPSCGSRAGQVSPVAPANVSPVVKAAGVSGLKVILIVLGVMFVFGALAVGGIYYAGHRFVQHMERVVGQPDLASSLREASVQRGVTGARRDGCALLSKSEAESVLDTTIEKADGALTQNENIEHCDYFVKPGTVEQDEDKLRENAREFQARKSAIDKVNGANLNDQARKEGVENLAKSFMRTMAASSGNGDVPFFSFTVERDRGKTAFGVFRTANVIIGSAAKGSNETLSGLGDRALMGPMDSVLSVLKDNTCITLNLTQVPNGKEKGIALAQKILSRL